HDRMDGAANGVRRNSHLSEPAESARGVGGVERRDEELAGKRSLDGNGGGFGGANLADEDYFRVLPHERPQPGEEIEAGGLGNLRLGDAGEDDFHGIFERGD